MSKKIVFLESNAKQRTIQGFLRENYLVLSTGGHIYEIANTGEYNLGIDLKNFNIEYKLKLSKKRVISEWKKTISKVNPDLYLLATDPDREGEAIAHEIIKELNLDKSQFKRLVFHEITFKAINEGIENLGEVNYNLIESQNSRSVLDKIIGFRLSSILQKNLKAYSAGRVQSAVLRIIVNKEKEIEKYEKEKIEKYFVEGEIKTEKEKTTIKETDEEGNLFFFSTRDEAEKNIKNVFSGDQCLLEIFKTTEEIKKIRSKQPFTTSSLLFEAKKTLGLSIKETTQIAQKLYEGVSINGKRTGLITYPRTDAIRLSSVFMNQAFSYITSNWGKEYCSFFPYWKESKTKHEQGAHESIRPSYLNYSFEELKDYLEDTELKLYKLIFDNTIASLMDWAQISEKVFIFKTTKADSNQKTHYYKAIKKTPIFLGFLAINPAFYFSNYGIEKKTLLTKKTKDPFVLESLWVSEFEEGKPYRFNEGSLVKELERVGIGRPSTYNLFSSILLSRHYVLLNKFKQILPTNLGLRVNDWLEKHFGDIINLEYTANLEKELDKISRGENNYINFIKSFWTFFSKKIEAWN